MSPGPDCIHGLDPKQGETLALLSQVVRPCPMSEITLNAWEVSLGLTGPCPGSPSSYQGPKFSPGPSQHVQVEFHYMVKPWKVTPRQQDHALHLKSPEDTQVYLWTHLTHAQWAVSKQLPVVCLRSKKWAK